MFTAKLRSDKRAKPEYKNYRFLSFDECKRLPQNGRVPVVDLHGEIAQVKITSVKTWKTRPHIVVNWQFGLYEYGHETLMPDRENTFFVAEVS